MPTTTAPEEAGNACGDKRRTDAGYQRHRRKIEKACAECLKAHSEYSSGYREGKRLRVKKEVVELDREDFLILWRNTSRVTRDMLKHRIPTLHAIAGTTWR
ncbi:hypothetical protein [Nocardia sp. NPDC051570]|uniref:hypothetical protein n=1 Tax=Nocardia sp. NPDC051570 TaxID=3364324 RepID=UPI0037B5A26D